MTERVPVPDPVPDLVPDPVPAVPAPVEGALLRAAAARLPGGVVVVTVRWRGHDQAMTATSVVSASLEPPLLLLCVHADSRLREALDDVPGWAVTVLDDGAAPQADWLSSPGRPAVDQLARVPHHRAPWSGAAWLDSGAAWFDLRTVAVHPAGDHDVVLGEVVAVREADPARGGLVHLRGRLRPVR
ncbi:flavin reductase family protein [Cellulomonas marina]|uniref:NADH-FMN oxidoreductase RutF, flavin reductase (DIM6/NTAB) family n=1 Tax=Cellulomonas marina TaxID=988821 RepID=A0A1I0ZIS5_9CELL|nr:flavin reductase family protein [Cellulomonas marina]GIG28602.1 hypothetical protein Cma02nite_12020 [Cellulomonas marina]SFB25262.1 NADH-FMN oxidoreductase RutF, flavin reductase (DIM6/NTAB) family [Cellulomonas marina]